MEAYVLKSWKNVVTPHDDILKGELEMSTYAADLAAVHRNDPNCPLVYRDAKLFFQSTYLTSNLRSLLTDALGVLAGGPGDRVLQLRTPFGGGKTHSLVALYHVAAHRGDLAGMADLAALPNPGPVEPIVLSGLELDPSTGRTMAGRTVRTLWGELAMQAGGPEAYALVEEQDQTRIAPGGEIVRRILSSGRAKLILLDEVLVYVAKAMGIPLNDSSVGRQVLVFLQTLTEVVRGLPNVALVYSLQASIGEAAGDDALLSTLDHLVSRVDAKREPVTGDEVMLVIQRRLFKSLGDTEVREKVATQYAEAYGKLRRSMAETSTEGAGADREAEIMRERILSSYPFHPDLLDLMYHRWGTLASYQRTRGALQFLANVVYALWHRDSAGEPLIGPGDVPLDDAGARSAFFTQVGQREPYAAVLSRDLTGTTARVLEVDRRVAAESPALLHRRLGTRLATAAMLYSFGARGGDDRGVLEHELIASCLAPGLDRPTLATALSDLREQLLYLHYTGRRYRFETEPNLNMLIGEEARKWQSDEVEDRVEADLTRLIRADKGKALIWPEEIPDRQPEFCIAFMDPEWADLPQERHLAAVREQVENRGSTKREYRNAIAIAVPGRQPMDKALQAARTLMGVESLAREPKRHGLKPEQIEQLTDRKRSLAAELESSLRRLYEFLYLPVVSRSGTEPYGIERIDLRINRSGDSDLYHRITEALRIHVFDQVLPGRLVTLTQLGQPAADGSVRQFVSCRQLVDWFFSIFDFSKVYTTDAIARGIAQGVTEGTIGYVAAARLAGTGALVVDNPAHVRLGQSTYATEIDLTSPGAYILAPDFAAGLKPAPAPQPDPDPEGVTPPVGPDPVVIPPVDPVPPPPDGPKPGEWGTHYVLDVTADKCTVFQVWQAIESLSDKADTLQVTIRVEARSGSGFDPVWLRNAVEELLTEEEIPFKGRLES